MTATLTVLHEASMRIEQIRAGRYFSPQRSFDVADGDAVNFRCYPAMLWPRLLASLAVPSLGISLKRE